ncbi:MAG: ABC transporter permease, partial [Hyphomicrobiaceae bacterium]
PRLLWTLPLWTLLSLVLATGMALVVSSLNVFVRDMQAVVPLVVTLWFWLTPIVWPLAQVPQEWRWLAMLNPMGIVVEGYRSALTGAPLPFDIGAAGLAVGLAAAVCGLTSMLFSVLRPSFADSL